ncbi:hypothetical protein [Streptomyces sp. NPDC059909]|uniref:hypothetical protein n=1 Tax=Streptomyces sp. NPDC059909 TaxID=3346998 RepID=UPI003645FCCD
MESGLSFSTADLAQTRFAVSPMWEVVTSFRLLRDGAEPPLHRRWAAQVRPRLTQAGLDRGWPAELIPARGYLADFLNPTPAAPFPTLAAELEAIRRTRPGQVLTDLEMLRAERDQAPSPRIRLLEQAPEAALEKVCAEIETYWESPSGPTGPAYGDSSKRMCSTAPAGGRVRIRPRPGRTPRDRTVGRRHPAPGPPPLCSDT